MAIEIPSEVALFLNWIGIPYPDVNEDDVRALGRYVHEFAQNVEASHESATGVVTDMGAVYSGESYEALVAAWATMSASHMAELDAACHVVATALDIAADVITAVKVAVLAELAALAASYAVALTIPGGAAFGVAIREVCRRLCNGMEEMLVSYIAAEVIGRAIEPLEHTIDRLIRGTVRYTLGLPEPHPSGSAVQALYIDPDEVLRYADILDAHADQILQHAGRFAENVAALNFITRGEEEGSDDLHLSSQQDSPAVSVRSPHDVAGPGVGSAAGHASPVRGSIGPYRTDISSAGVQENIPTPPGPSVRQSSNSGPVPTAATASDVPQNSVTSQGRDISATTQPNSTAQAEPRTRDVSANDPFAPLDDERMPLESYEAVVDQAKPSQFVEGNREVIPAQGSAASNDEYSRYPVPVELAEEPFSPTRQGGDAQSIPGASGMRSGQAATAPSTTASETRAQTPAHASSSRRTAGRKSRETPWSKLARSTDTRKPDVAQKVTAPPSQRVSAGAAESTTVGSKEEVAGRLDGVPEIPSTESNPTRPPRRTIVLPPAREP
ncbi:hypothetical protein IU427_25600 [Nocardia beijingensis]|uniref:WXG100-like domain-containing protein n=1 Tax=Nocardia beijingensis TaxID=95162 RepID=UPI001895D3E9|nr:hypothetical protein [Nocardia beijingensis]MBF6468514.1 hypothetical protein [Nocardia beijingensis]